MAKHGLTPKQKAFADEYIANKGNATQAAINAGYSEGTAKEMGYENLTKPHVRAYIDKRLEDKMADLMNRGSQVVEQLMSFAFRDLKRRLMEAQVRRVELENEALEAKIRPKEGQEEQVGHFIDSLGEYYDDEEEEPRPQDVHQETKPGDEESQE